MRYLMMTLAALVLSSNFAFATGNQSSDLSAFGGFGQFGTFGSAGANSAYGGQSEAFANGSAGLTFSRCSTCGGATFGGWQNNEAGAMTQGNAAGSGFSTGGASGAAAGGFVRMQGFRHGR